MQKQPSGAFIQPARATRASQVHGTSLHRALPANESVSRIPLRDVGARANVVAANKPLFAQATKPLMKPTVRRSEKISNPQSCADYDAEIFRYMLEVETLSLPSSNIFENQTNLTPKMRSTLVDWLVDVHKKDKMHTDTLFFAINYIDRYLMMRDIDKSKFQLLGSAAMLIASKTEEIYPLSCVKLVHLAGDSFTVVGLNRMETSLFSVLEFNTTPITASHFLKRFLQYANGSSTFNLFAHFVNETLLLDAEFIGIKPSKIASAVLRYAMAIIPGAPIWTKEIESQVVYSIAELKPIVNMIHCSIVSSFASRCQAIRKKYASKENESVSTIELPKDLYI